MDVWYRTYVHVFQNLVRPFVLPLFIQQKCVIQFQQYRTIVGRICHPFGLIVLTQFHSLLVLLLRNQSCYQVIDQHQTHFPLF